VNLITGCFTKEDTAFKIIKRNKMVLPIAFKDIMGRQSDFGFKYAVVLSFIFSGAVYPDLNAWFRPTTLNMQ
jgi:hypothetical protein